MSGSSSQGDSTRQIAELVAELVATKMKQAITEEFIMPLQQGQHDLCARMESLEKTIESNNGLKQLMKTMQQTCITKHQQVDSNFSSLLTLVQKPAAVVKRWAWVALGVVGTVGFIGGVVAAFGLKIVVK